MDTCTPLLKEERKYSVSVVMVWFCSIHSNLRVAWATGYSLCCLAECLGPGTPHSPPKVYTAFISFVFHQRYPSKLPLHQGLPTGHDWHLVGQLCVLEGCPRMLRNVLASTHYKPGAFPQVSQLKTSPDIVFSGRQNRPNWEPLPYDIHLYIFRYTVFLNVVHKVLVYAF